MANKPKRGGARKGAGRKTEDGATDLVRVNMTIRADQREKLDKLGGSAWLRKAIDAARAAEKGTT